MGSTPRAAAVGLARTGNGSRGATCSDPAGVGSSAFFLVYCSAKLPNGRDLMSFLFAFMVFETSDTPPCPNSAVL